MKTNSQFERLVNDAVAQSFSGWDFSFVQGRINELDTSWNYRELVENRISNANAMVDMCTGGGEFIASLNHLPSLTYATEGFAPNVEIARKRLATRGVRVVAVDSDDELPLPSCTFDLVINRHGAYSPTELRRILKRTGAIFLTQQVGSDNAAALNEALHAPPSDFPDWRLETATGQLQSLGFSITRCEEEFPIMSFDDIGAVVFYLKAIPWQIPHFDVSIYQERLFALNEKIERIGSFNVPAHRFLIEAKID